MITGDFPPAITGVGDYTRRLVESLGALHVRVEVFTGTIQGVQDWGPRVLGPLLRSMDRLGPGAVAHIQYPALAYGRWPTINLLPAVLKLLRPRCPVIVTMHEFRSMRWRWRVRALPMLLAADAVILADELDRATVSRWTRRTGTRLTSIPIAPNILPHPMLAGDRAIWREELRLPGPEPIVVFFGGVYEHKGILELITAVEGIRDAGLRARLLIVGEPDPGGRFQDRVEGLLAPGTADGWARWIPGARPEIVSRALQAADLAALPFRSGAMANRGSLLVALAHGLPAVTTRSAATPPSFGPSTGMALVPPQDAPMLQACLDELLRSPAKRQSLGQAALDYSRGFSWEAIADRTLDLYHSLLPGSTQTSGRATAAAPEARR
jgi:glycosyltransferase involved in cell wall biosynthesis